MAAEVTDWISASANVAAAIGTVGALWVGAVTLRRPVNDQHRTQARAVTVGTDVEVGSLQQRRLRCFVTNNSHLPIYTIEFRLIVDQRETRSERADVLAPGKTVEFYADFSEDRAVLSEFYDSAGTRWLRNDTGHLIEFPDKVWERRKMLFHLWWNRKRDPGWLKVQA